VAQIIMLMIEEVLRFFKMQIPLRSPNRMVLPNALWPLLLQTWRTPK